MHEMAHHRCSKRNIDGTNRLIKKGDVCSRPTNIPFWMSIHDVINSAKTRLQEWNQKDVKKNRLWWIFYKKNIDKQLKNHLKQRLK